jgi:hypothetical protein
MTYLKISGTDLTSYIQEYRYTKNPVEISSKVASSGFRTRKLGAYKLGVIEVKFRAGLSAAQVSTALSALNVDDKGTFEFWDSVSNLARQAEFYVTVEDVKTTGTYDSFSAILEQAGIASDLTETVVSSFAGTVTDKASNYTDEANIQANNGSYCTCTGATNVNQQLVLSNFTWLDAEDTPTVIPENAVINYIELEIKYKVSTASSSIILYMVPAYKGSYRGTSWGSKNEPLTDLTVTARFPISKWTYTELNSTDTQIWIGYKRYSSTACTLSIDYAKFTLSYTGVG